MEQDKAMQDYLNKLAEDEQAWLDRNEAEGGVCDFCARRVNLRSCAVFVTDDAVTETLSVLDTETLGAASIDLFYEKAWAACDRCAEVVRQGNPAALAQHALHHRDKKRIGPIGRSYPVVLREITALYTRLYANNLREVTKGRDEFF